MWRVTPDFAVRDAYKESFAPGFDVESGFDDPDQVLADFDAMTYTSFDTAQTQADDYVEELPLNERFKQMPVPLLVIFGAEDQIFDAEQAVQGYADVPGVQTELSTRPATPRRSSSPKRWQSSWTSSRSIWSPPSRRRRSAGGDQRDRPKKPKNGGSARRRDKRDRWSRPHTHAMRTLQRASAARTSAGATARARPPSTGRRRRLPRLPPRAAHRDRRALGLGEVDPDARPRGA